MKNLLTSLLSLLLIVAILAPSLFKLTHALLEHQEQLCQEVGSVHIHEIEIDCDFQKFNLSPQTYPSFEDVNVPVVNLGSVEILNNYFFLSKYQKLHFALRGPPIS